MSFGSHYIPYPCLNGAIQQVSARFATLYANNKLLKELKRLRF